MFQEVEFVVDIHPQYDSIFLVNELMISTRLLTWTRGTVTCYESWNHTWDGLFVTDGITIIWRF